ncbi:Homoserine/homoserine lactone efflux protein [Bacillus rhizoplanae]|uniref:Homoserine/homoserine lactone efflux protein n=1 Tax=Bacillus rhizoplanae TaxID=2880966 RepID=A0ABM8YEQ2_9BACI|nr:LysE family translocator [Bacillus rhizoplanae]CAG9614309.1 Homoserine/homoserine lactone efflux protein [Bacillus rhizoplanae]
MEHYYLFVMMSIFLILLPGPDTAIATQNTLTLGRSGGLKTMFGTCCALSIHTAAAILGLSTIIVQSAFLFSIIKYVGAIYLVYLGIRALWPLKTNKATVESNINTTYKTTSCFFQGFLTNLLNPKVAIFFLTFLPQFIDAKSNTFIQFLTMGMTYTVLTAIWFLLYIYFIHRVRTFMKKPVTQRIMQSITGTALIGFGIKLALERKI